MSMIPPMRRSAGDTLFRAIVMGAVLGFVVWAAVRYTTIPQQMLHEVIKWSEKASAHLASDHQRDPSQTAGAPSTGGYAADGSGYQAIHTDYSSRGSGGSTASRIPTEVEDGYQGQQVDHRATASHAREPFEVIDQRLRELGAVYCMLETWGRQSPRYRYLCRIALDGDEQHTRSFEAHGRSPREAMLQVLKDVEEDYAQAGLVERRTW